MGNQVCHADEHQSPKNKFYEISDERGAPPNRRTIADKEKDNCLDVNANPGLPNVKHSNSKHRKNANGKQVPGDRRATVTRTSTSDEEVKTRIEEFKTQMNAYQSQIAQLRLRELDQKQKISELEARCHFLEGRRESSGSERGDNTSNTSATVGVPLPGILAEGIIRHRGSQTFRRPQNLKTPMTPGPARTTTGNIWANPMEKKSKKQRNHRRSRSTMASPKSISTPKESKLRRRRSFTFAMEHLENSVWLNELDPREHRTTVISKEWKKKRRRSLAVYTSSGDTEMALNLDETNADKFIYLAPAYAFKLNVDTANTMEKQLGLDTANDLGENVWVVHTVDEGVDASERNNARVLSEAEFRKYFTCVNATEHKYAKCISVFAVLLREEAEIKRLDSLGIITEDAKSERNTDPGNKSTFSLATYTKSSSTKSSRSIRNKQHFHKRPDIEQDHQHSIGSEGDFLVQDVSGHQWFVRQNDFHSLYMRKKDFDTMKDVEDLMPSWLEDRLREKSLWRIRKPRSPVHLTPPIQQHLEDILEWDFDIFRLSDLTMNSPLYFVGYAIFRKFNLLEDVGGDEACFRRFLLQIQDGYKKNVYHNSMHGADVCQASAHMLVALRKTFSSRSKFPLGFSSLEVTALLISALAHDLGHPGTNNAFEIKTYSNLALCYNDRSVLESFHAAECFAILKSPSCNIFRHLQPSEWSGLRFMMIELILSTDLEHHRSFIRDFDLKCQTIYEKLISKEKNKTGNNVKQGDANSKSKPVSSSIAFEIMQELSSTAEGRLMIMKFILKCADIGHPARILPLHKRWSSLIQDEFFLQGDKEAKLGLPVSRGMNRKETRAKDIAKGNVGFIQYLVSPLYELMEKRVRNPQFSRNIESNKKYWERVALRSRSSSPKSRNKGTILNEKKKEVKRRPSLNVILRSEFNGKQVNRKLSPKAPNRFQKQEDDKKRQPEAKDKPIDNCVSCKSTKSVKSNQSTSAACLPNSKSSVGTSNQTSVAAID